MKRPTGAELRSSPKANKTLVRDVRVNLTRRCGDAENVRKERKEMEGGNGESKANEVTLRTAHSHG